MVAPTVQLVYDLVDQILNLLITLTVILIVGNPRPSVTLDFPHINPLHLVEHPPTVRPKLLFLLLVLGMRLWWPFLVRYYKARGNL